MVSSHVLAATDAAGWSNVAHGWTCGQCGLAKALGHSKVTQAMMRHSKDEGSTLIWRADCNKVFGQKAKGGHAQPQQPRQLDLPGLSGKVSGIDIYKNIPELLIPKRAAQENAGAKQAKLLSQPHKKTFAAFWAASSAASARTLALLTSSDSLTKSARTHDKN